MPGPCTISPTSTSRFELAFIPSESSKGVEVRTSIFANGGVKQYSNPMPDIDLVAGKEYVLTGAGGVTPELRGNLFTSQVEIMRSTDKQVLACTQADYYAV